LDRAAVVRAAAALLDEAEGKEVTLAALAAHLGVRTPSLYNHIGGQDELRHELAVLGVRELGERMGRAAIGKAGEDAILAIGHAYRDFSKERPGLYSATLRAPGPGDAALIAASEDVLTILRLVLAPYQLADDDLIHAMRALRSLVHGFVSLELIGGFGIPVDLDASFQRLLDLYLSGLRSDKTAGTLAIAE
jgi:AcrR family transcriptional regulator